MHDHDHDHHHDHDGHHHPRPASDVELRARALEALLVEKGLVSSDAIDAVIDRYVNDVGPQNGARVVARAWTDPAYRDRLLTDGTAAIGELGYAGEEGHTMVVVENTPDVHKSAPYRARVVAEPRAVLEEFGVEVPATTEIRVWDSTAEVRYLVLPMRPEGTEALAEEELAELVSRDSMIGTGLPQTPAAR